MVRLTPNRKGAKQSLWISLNIFEYPRVSLHIVEYCWNILGYPCMENPWISLSIIEYLWISLNILEYHRIASQSIGKAPPRGRPSRPIALYTLELGVRCICLFCSSWYTAYFPSNSLWNQISIVSRGSNLPGPSPRFGRETHTNKYIHVKTKGNLSNTNKSEFKLKKT